MHIGGQNTHMRMQGQVKEALGRKKKFPETQILFCNSYNRTFNSDLGAQRFRLGEKQIYSNKQTVPR